MFFFSLSLIRSLDKNEYNHITATYFLLAERKLRSKRQDHVIKNKRPEKLAVPQATPVPKHDINKGVNPCLLSVPRTPGDLPQVKHHCHLHHNCLFLFCFQLSALQVLIQFLVRVVQQNFWFWHEYKLNFD